MITHYYANAGDDGDAGDLAHPWQTIAKFNATALAGDDAALFNRGDEFVGRLHPTDSGSSGHVILLGAYGTGDDPIIDGSADNAFYVSFDSNYVHHFWVEHIDFSGSINHTGDYDSTVVCNSHDFYWYMCTFRDSGGTPDGHGFQAFSDEGSEIYNVIVDTCNAYNNTSSGICISSNAGSGGPHNCEVKYCRAHDNGTIEWYHHGIYVKFGVTVHHNTCYNNSFGGGLKLNCESVYDSPYYPVCYSNDSYDNFIGIVAGHKDAVVYDNLIVSNDYNVNCDGDARGMLFYFNTLVNAHSAMFRIDGHVGSNTLGDNLIIQDRAVEPHYIYMGVGSTDLDYWEANNSFDWNTYYTNGDDSTIIFYDSNTSWSWAYWVGMGDDPNGTFLLSLPEVTARYTDMHPLSGSGGGYFEGLGIAIGGYETDMDGVTRSDPPTPGCYDFAGGGPPPPPVTPSDYGPSAWMIG